MKRRLVLFTSMPMLMCAVPAIAQSPPPAPPARPPACTSVEHRQFDFWVGRWDVHRTANGQLVARSLIERLYGGCAIRENWMPLEGEGGGSLNAYLPGQDMWRQTWVDSMNSWAVFEGGLADGAMRLQGVWPGAAGPGSEPLVRISWTREEAGAVRQFGEISHDEGGSWFPFFDLTYRPSAGEEAEADDQ